MVSKRLIHEDGHRRKFLVIVDDTPECDRAILYAARRAVKTGGEMILLYVIPPADFQHWIGVEEIMRAEAQEAADSHLIKFASYAKENADIDPQTAIREGKVDEEILKLIEEDQDIAILVLAAGEGTEGPGPLVSSIAGKSSPFPIPVIVVPCEMSNEDIDSVT